MVEEIDLIREQSILSELRRKLQILRPKRHSIQHQFKNRLVRNDASKRMIARREKRKVLSQIKASENRIISLREALLGGL